MFHPVTKNRATAVTLLLAALCGGQVCAAAVVVNYDTAWTFVYDEGDSAEYWSWEKFYDVEPLANGGVVCVGLNGFKGTASLLMKLDSNGKLIKQKLYSTLTEEGKFTSQSLRSITIAQNGDYLVCGERGIDAFAMRLDTAGTIKWSVWYHDSVWDKPKLLRRATMNCIKETSKKQIICTGGDPFPNNDGSALDSYSGTLIIDSVGNIKDIWQDPGSTGYSIAGFNVDELKNGNIIISGNQSVKCLDTNSFNLWKTQYTFSLDGVGTVTNNIFRAKVLRSGALMACGMAYEGNCWTSFRRLSYDAWWARLQPTTGSAITWDTAGWQGGSDAVYDFAQLNDGTIAFCGVKGTPADSGFWVFVTDSSGKNLLWERQYNLPGRDSGGFYLTNMIPMAVCATTDGGFTVVGDNNTYKNNHNAFAVHFERRAVGVIPSARSKSTKMAAVKIAVNNASITFTLAKPPSGPVRISIYNASGKKIAAIENENNTAGRELVWNAGDRGKGVFVYRVSGNWVETSGKVVLK